MPAYYIYTCICAHTVLIMREYYRFIILQSNLQCFVEKQNRVIEHSRSVIKTVFVNNFAHSDVALIVCTN